jgi:hypothetical protein
VVQLFGSDCGGPARFGGEERSDGPGRFGEELGDVAVAVAGCGGYCFGHLVLVL